MGTTAFKSNPVHTAGELPKAGSTVHFSKLIRNDLSAVSSETYAGKNKIISIFPSIDTGVCQASVRRFNEEATKLKNTVVLNVSMDLPFANSRFCGAEGIKNCETLSAFRSTFGKDFGIVLQESPLMGLFARAVVVVSPDNKVLHSELVSEITQEPNYAAAIKAVN